MSSPPNGAVGDAANTTAAPSDLATSILENQFFGPHLTKREDKHRSCVDHIQNHIAHYGYDCAIMTLQKGGNTGRHTHTRHKDTNEQYLYCARCTVHSNSIKNRISVSDYDFRCCVIAAFKCVDVTADEATRHNIPASWKKTYLTKLYPHPIQCTCANSAHLLKNYMSLSNWGPGFTIIDLHLDSIVGEIFTPILQKLEGVTKNDLQVVIGNKWGKKIRGGHSKETQHDIRGIIPLYAIHDDLDNEQKSINKNYGLAEENFQENLALLTTRLTLLLANSFDIAGELIKIEVPDCMANEPTPTNDNRVAHLHLKNPSIIFGGYKRENKPLSDQCPHVDFGTSIEADPQQVSTGISDNSRLNGMFKPSSIIIPLGNHERSMVIHRDVHGKLQSKQITIKPNQAIVFEGNVTHSGITYVENTPPNDPIPDLHPALHFYLYSNLHECDVDSFHVNSYHLLNFKSNETHLPLLHPTEIYAQTMHTIAGAQNIIQRSCKRLKATNGFDDKTSSERLKSVIATFQNDVQELHGHFK